MRDYKHLTKSDRIEISILLKKDYSFRDIGKALGKNHSSIGREVRRNSAGGEYDWRKAHHKATVSRQHSKHQGMKVRGSPKLEKYIEEKLRDPWSWTPEQIAGRWNKEKHVDEKGKIIAISSPSIYKYLYSPYGQRLCKFLPSKQYYPKRKRGKKKPKREMIPNRISIDERPKKVLKRKEFGHFEGDTLGKIKTDSEVIAGLTERKSRYVMLSKVSRLKHALNGFKERLNPYLNVTESLTLDNGVENKKHRELKVQTYFCHPYSSWEKGSIENGFLRLRRFIPKKSSLKDFSNEYIKIIENKMNNTPRKCLGFKTPLEVFEEEIETKKKALNDSS